MFRIVWTETAAADLDDIWRYTERSWDEEQADLYISAIHEDMGNSEAIKLRARRIDHVSPDLWRMHHTRHFVYFRYTGETIQISRVLHDMMDDTLHLP